MKKAKRKILSLVVLEIEDCLKEIIEWNNEYGQSVVIKFNAVLAKEKLKNLAKEIGIDSK